MWARKSRNCGGGEFGSFRAACAGRMRRRARLPDAALDPEILCLQPLRVVTLLRALGLAVRRWERIAGLVARVLLRGKESPKRRLKALLHTWLGAYYAVLLRRSRSGSHPRASRIFRVVDRDGGGADAGREFQHDAARVRPAAQRRLSRHEAEALPVLHDHFGVQPAPYFEKFSGSRSAQNHRLAAGCGCAGTRGIAEGCPGHTPHLHIAGGGTAACGEGSRVSGSRLCATARWWTRF